jgi:predicted nucleic acid-binding protein
MTAEIRLVAASAQAKVDCQYSFPSELSERVRQRLPILRRADELVAVIKSWPVEFVHSDEALCIAAGEIKARFLVSFADALSVQLHSDLVRS